MKSSVIKRCITCGRFLSIDDFNWNNKEKGYKSSYCKKCRKTINSLRDKDERKEYNKNNSEIRKQHYLDNKDIYKKRNKKWRENNKDKKIINSIKWKYNKKNQTPELTKEEQDRIKQLYKIRDLLNHDKVDFHVDHIRPLFKGGLHHPDNLQILPNWLNCEKSIKWPLTEQEEIRYEGFKL